MEGQGLKANSALASPHSAGQICIKAIPAGPGKGQRSVSSYNRTYCTSRINKASNSLTYLNPRLLRDLTLI
jgi:hypothetical protein